VISVQTNLQHVSQMTLIYSLCFYACQIWWALQSFFEVFMRGNFICLDLLTASVSKAKQIYQYRNPNGWCLAVWTTGLFDVCCTLSLLDIDECVMRTHNCGIGFQCQNTDGSFTCNLKQRCLTGFTQDSHGNCIGMTRDTGAP